MDEMLQMIASMGLGNLSPAQLASVLGPEEMSTIQQMDGLRSLRAQAPEDDTESFIRGHIQEITHAKEMLEASRRHAPDSRIELTKYVHSESSRRHQFQFELSLGV